MGSCSLGNAPYIVPDTCVERQVSRIDSRLPRSKSKSPAVKPWRGHRAATGSAIDALMRRVACTGRAPLHLELILLTACEVRAAVAHRTLAALLGSDALIRLHAARLAFAEIAAADAAQMCAEAISGFTRTLDGRLPGNWVRSLEDGLPTAGECLDILISIFAANCAAPAQQSLSPRRHTGRANQGSRTRAPAGLWARSANPMAPSAKLQMLRACWPRSIRRKTARLGMHMSPSRARSPRTAPQSG